MRVAVIGAGVIGLFCAAALARRGARVTVIEGEKEDFSVHGPAASLAAAGMLAPLSEALGGTLGEAPAHPQADVLAFASFGLWRAQHAQAAWRDGVRFDGGALIAKDAATGAVLETAAMLHGCKIKTMGAALWRTRTGLEMPPTAPAYFVADEGVADPQRVLSALVMDARAHGATFLFGHDVEAIEAQPLRARCTRGELIEADRVVLAPGIWADDRVADAAPALKCLRPAKGQIAPAALSADLKANMHGPGFYLAQRGRDDVVLGATMEWDISDRRTDRTRIAALFAAADTVLPGAVRPLLDAFPWAGVRPMSPDGAPLIGPNGHEGVLLAAGHGRNGWLNAPITAEIICAYVYGEEIAPLWAAFHPARFEQSDCSEKKAS